MQNKNKFEKETKNVQKITEHWQIQNNSNKDMIEDTLNHNNRKKLNANIASYNLSQMKDHDQKKECDHKQFLVQKDSLDSLVTMQNKAYNQQEQRRHEQLVQTQLYNKYNKQPKEIIVTPDHSPEKKK